MSFLAQPARPNPCDVRTLICTLCSTRVEVCELPCRYLEPDTYRCGDCMLKGAPVGVD